MTNYLFFPLRISQKQSEIQMLHVLIAKVLSILCEEFEMKESIARLSYFITYCNEVKNGCHLGKKYADIRLRQSITLISKKS